MATLHQSGPSSTCPICDGTGWKQLAVPGKASRMTRCDCRMQSQTDQLLKAAHIPVRYEHCTLANYETEFSGAHRSLVTARLTAGRFVEEYPIQKSGILFIGSIGTGKTHLAVGIIQELMRSKKIACLFCDYRDLLKQIIDSYNPTVEATELEVLRPIVDSEVVVLDELGAVKSTQWVWETVSYVINSRYNQNKTTIITTNFPNLPAGAVEGRHKNFSQAELAKAASRYETLGDRITDRMRSRLHEMCRIVEVEGVDYRTGPKKNHSW
jgi:DNA replication protein DnaC